MRKRPFIWLIFGLIGLAAVNLAFLIAAPGQRVTVALDDISECLMPLGAALACLRTALLRQGRTRQAWVLIGISAASWGLGQAVWTYQEVLLGLHPADYFPSYSDLGFLLAVPFALIGLLRLPGAPTTTQARLRFVLDGLIIAGALLFISWALVLGPVYANSSSSIFATVVGLAYPLSDVALVTIVLLTVSHLPARQREARTLLAGGLLLTALADSFFAYLTTVRGFGSSNPIDLGWTMGYALIGVAAIRSRATAGVTEARQSRWNALLPYWTMAAAGAVAIVTEITVGSLDKVLEWDLLFTITVVLARQFLLVRETRWLNEQIASRNDNLGQQVRERTRALTESLEELNHINEERRQLLLRMVTLQEEEWQHIADVIHDDMLQSMIGAKMRMFLLHDGGGTDAQTAASIESAIDRAIVRMRSLMTDLRPHITDMGLIATLEQSVGELNEDGRLAVTLHNHLTGEPSGIVGTTMYRIVREALTNAHKHADRAAVTVTLRGGLREGYNALISDNGPGFTPRSDGRSPMGHRGISSMRERAEALGGWLRLESAEGDGTTIEVWLPQQLEVVPEEAPAA